jgi:hypothetical protein
MTDDRMDLSALDPASDPARLDRMAATIRARAARALAERCPTVATELAAWTRAVLPAAAAIALLVTTALLSSSEEPPGANQSAQTTPAGDITGAAVQWAVFGQAPTTSDLFTMIGAQPNEQPRQ